MSNEAGRTDYRTGSLNEQTWADFAALVEANNGVWGGCWCMGFHPEGLDKTSAERNRDAKAALVHAGSVRQILVYDGDDCVGWCQFGSPAELPNIQNRRTYAASAGDPPDWRIGCIFTGRGHRQAGVSRAAVSGALEAIRRQGGGVVEAYPEQVDGRAPQRGSYFHTGPESLFAGLGFERVRKIAKWRWVMRLTVD